MTTFEAIPATSTSTSTHRKEMTSYGSVGGLSDVDSIASDVDEDASVLFGPMSTSDFRKQQSHDSHNRRTQVLMLMPLDDVYFNTPENEASAVRIQTWWRSIMARRQYLRMRTCALLIQTMARGMLARRIFHRRKFEFQQLALKGSVSARRRLNGQARVPPPLAVSRSDHPLSRSEPMIASPPLIRSATTPTGAPSVANSPAPAIDASATKVRRGRSIRNWFQRSSPSGSETSDAPRSPYHNQSSQVNTNHHHVHRSSSKARAKRLLSRIFTSLSPRKQHASGTTGSIGGATTTVNIVVHAAAEAAATVLDRPVSSRRPISKQQQKRLNRARRYFLLLGTRLAALSPRSQRNMVGCSTTSGMLSHQSLLAANHHQYPRLSIQLSTHTTREAAPAVVAVAAGSSKDTPELHRSQSTLLFPAPTTTTTTTTTTNHHPISLSSSALTQPISVPMQHSDAEMSPSPSLKPKRSMLRAKIGLLGRSSPSPRSPPEGSSIDTSSSRVPMVTTRVYPVVEIDKEEDERTRLPQSPPMSIRSVQAAVKPQIVSPLSTRQTPSSLVSSSVLDHSGSGIRSGSYGHPRSPRSEGFQKTRAQPPLSHQSQADGYGSREDTGSPIESAGSGIATDSDSDSQDCDTTTHGTTVDSSLPFIPLKSTIAPEFSLPPLPATAQDNVESVVDGESENDDLPLAEIVRIGSRDSGEAAGVFSPMVVDDEQASQASLSVHQARKIADTGLASDMDFRISSGSAVPAPSTSIAHIDHLFQMAEQNTTPQQQKGTHGDQELSPRLSLRLSANSSAFSNFNISAFAPLAEPIIECPESMQQDAPAAAFDQNDPGMSTESIAKQDTVEEGDTNASTVKDTGNMVSVMSRQDADTPQAAESQNAKEAETPAQARLRSLRARRLGLAVTGTTSSNASATDKDTSSGSIRRFRATQTMPKTAAGTAAGGKHAAGQKPLSKMGPLQLDRLTKLNTRRNSTYLTCKIEKYTVTMDGDRPPSPSSMMQERALLRRVARGEINEDGEYIYASDSSSDSDDDDLSDVSMASESAMQLLAATDGDTVGLGVANLPANAGVSIQELVVTRPLTPDNDEFSDADLANLPGSGRALLEGFQEAGPVELSRILESSDNLDGTASGETKRKSIELPRLPSVDTGGAIDDSDEETAGEGSSKKLCRRQRIQWGSCDTLTATRLLGRLPVLDASGTYNGRPGKPILIRDSPIASVESDNKSSAASKLTGSAGGKKVPASNNLKIVRVACITYPNSSAPEEFDSDDDDDEFIDSSAMDDEDEYVPRRSSSRKK